MSALPFQVFSFYHSRTGFSSFFCLLLLLSFLMKFFCKPHWESTTDVAIILLLFNIQEIKLRFLNKMILRASFQEQEEVRTY